MIDKNITIDELGELFRTNANYVLTSHVNPDGDALGSELACCRFLRALGKSVNILNHSPVPEFYRWLDPANDLQVYDPNTHRLVIEGADVIIVLDTNQPERLRSLERDVIASQARKVVIDH